MGPPRLALSVLPLGVVHQCRRRSERPCAERDPLHQGIIVERATLKQRDFSLNLTGRLGKSQVVTNSTPLNQQVRH